MLYTHPKVTFFCPPRFDFFENVCSAGSVIETKGKCATQLNSFIIGSLYRNHLYKWQANETGSSVPQLSQSVRREGAPCLHLFNRIRLCYQSQKLFVRGERRHHHLYSMYWWNMWDEHLGSTPGFSRSPVCPDQNGLLGVWFFYLHSTLLYTGFSNMCVLNYRHIYLTGFSNSLSSQSTLCAYLCATVGHKESVLLLALPFFKHEQLLVLVLHISTFSYFIWLLQRVLCICWIRNDGV